MPNSSAIPVLSVDDARQAKAKGKIDGNAPSALPSISPAGPRKLVRPRMPVNAPLSRYPGQVAPLSSRQMQKSWIGVRPQGESSHAEAFYFQKQIHSQTLMIFVLGDGEQVEGQIEWYDRDSIKVRNGGVRTLIYKSGIKYLYKASDRSASL